MTRTEIRVTGFGGQGVVLFGHIFGRACAIHAGMHATMIQSFGPEARGSSCSATLVVSDDEVLYPYISRPDIFVAMSAEGYDKYRGELADGGTLIFEQDLVEASEEDRANSYSVPSTRIAEQIGRAIVQNIVMLGFAAAAVRLVPKEAMRKAVADAVPAGTEELNLMAFDAGWEHFRLAYGMKQGAEAQGGVTA